MKLLNISYRIRRVLILYFSFMFLLLGCGRGDTLQPKERVEVSLWYYWEDERMQKALAEVIDDFHHSQNRIRVKTQYIPDEDFRKQLALGMADGKVPELALVDSSDFQYFHAMHPFVDLSEEIEEIKTWDAQINKACQVNGHMMGLPVGMNCAVLYYNKDILQEAGVLVPQNVEEISGVASKVAQNGKYGILFSAVQSEETMYSFLPIFWGYGGEVDSINSVQSQRAFSMLRDLINSGAMTRECMNLTVGDLIKQFAQGNTAMIIYSSNFVDSIRTMNPELNFDVALPPGNTLGEHFSIMGGEILGVLEEEKQKEAIEFLKFFKVAEKENFP